MITTTSIKTYSELITIPTFIGRFRYLRLGGRIGEYTFGYDRYLNQAFYRSKEWRDFRHYIIVRDMGCDLGIDDYEICGRIYIHHITPIRKEDITGHNLNILLNPENAICTSDITHKAIHYGDESLLVTEQIVRSRNDTCPWKM